MQDHLGRADLKLVAFTAHGFDQDRQMQLATAAHEEGVCRVGRLNPQSHVALQRALEPFLDLAAGHPRALASGEGRCVDAERHADRRLFHRDDRECARIVHICNRFADVDFRDAGQGDDLTRGRLRNLQALQALINEDLPDLLLMDLPSRSILATLCRDAGCRQTAGP